MEVSNFFTRLLQPPKESKAVKQPDDLGEFDIAWQGIKETLEQPDERQIVRGISSTQVPNQLRHIVDALVYESNRTDEDTTGACLEYFLKNDLLSQLERLCEPDRPYGIKAEVLRAINNLIVSLSERFLVHNAVHRPLRRLLRSCIGEEPEEKVDGGVRKLGAASMSPKLGKGSSEDIEEDLVGLMCTLASRMVAYPPLLLIFFHDKGWLQPHPAQLPTPLERARSPALSSHTGISGPSSKTTTHHFEFLLFSYLLRFVHREGQIGDPARAGLLFLFDIASLPSTEIVNGSPQLNNQDGTTMDPLQDARDALGEFILDGDFAEVMAAGLGAIYSLLPSKLHVPSLSEISELEREQSTSLDKSGSGTGSGGMYLGAGLEPSDRDDRAQSSTDMEVRDQLDLILKLFGFLQDIIHRCTSAIRQPNQEIQEISTTHMLGNAIAEATLDAIQSSFLDNVLYPSVLECSSHDGSSVAVLTYLEVLFTNLDEGPLLNRLLSFLMDTGSGTNLQPAEDKKKNKRKTGALGFIDQPIYTADYFADEGRFTLKDLLLDNIHSTEPASSTAALRLLRTLLEDQCQQSIKGLLSIIRDPVATALAKRPIPTELDFSMDSFLPHPVNSTDIHLQEMELYSSLITRLDPSLSSAEMAAGYSVYLTDITALIESNQCFRSAQIPMSLLDQTEKSFLHVDSTEEPVQHRLNPSDSLIKSILKMLGDFLSNTPDENVALTSVISSIAICPNRSLAGWLLYDIKPEFDPWKSKKDTIDSVSDINLDSDDDDSDIDIDGPLRQGLDPFSARNSIPLPAIYQILRELIRTISKYREDIDSFDKLLSERRQGLSYTDHLDEAMNVMLDVDHSSIFGFGTSSLPETPKPDKKVKRPSGAAGLVGGIKSFLTPKKKASQSPSSITPNRSSSSGFTPTLSNLLGSNANPFSTPKKSLSPSPNITSNLEDRASTPIKVDELDMLNPSPFKSHYEQTGIDVDILPSEEVRLQQSSAITAGPWSNNDNNLKLDRENHSLAINEDISFNADSSSSRPTTFQEDVEPDSIGQPKKISLNTILDNCVILEEFIKELVAIITVRRAMGIDQVGFI